MTGVWALVAFVGVIVVWNAVFKRNIGEAMILGFLAVCAFAFVGGVEGGGSPLSAIGAAVLDAMQEEVTFAGLAFVFMSYLLTRTPVLDRLIDLLNSVLGRLRGGPVYTATVAGGMFGAIAHVGAAVTAAVGSVTVPWMKRSGVSPALAATVAAGGAGMGVSFPFSSTMFILVGGLAAQGIMQPGEIVKPLALAGLWCLGYRLVLAFYLTASSRSRRRTGCRSGTACARAGPRCCCSCRSWSRCCSPAVRSPRRSAPTAASVTS